MPKIIALDDMTLDQLQAELDRLNAQRDSLKERIREIAPVLEAKRAQAEAQAKVAAMSAPERAALAQALRAEGIESAEAFGALGS